MRLVFVVWQKDASPFQKILGRFLTTNTLHTVCPWLDDTVAREIRSADDVDATSDEPSFVYCPPLHTVNARPLSTFMQPNPDAAAVARLFGVPVGFFWETVETGDDCFPDPVSADDVDGGLQTTMSLLSGGLFLDGKATMGVLGRVLQSGLSVAGLRLLYPTASHAATSFQQGSAKCGPVLAVGLRGAGARAVWLDEVGPSDPVLARRMDPSSLSALFGGRSRDSCLIYCPRNAHQTAAEVVRWFGGRVPDSRVIAVGESPSRPRVSGKGRRKSQPSPAAAKSQAALLCAMTYSDIFLAMSPLIPSHCLALVVCVFQRRGYSVCGVRRMHLDFKRSGQLGW